MDCHEPSPVAVRPRSARSNATVPQWECPAPSFVVPSPRRSIRPACRRATRSSELPADATQRRHPRRVPDQAALRRLHRHLRARRRGRRSPRPGALPIATVRQDQRPRRCACPTRRWPISSPDGPPPSSDPTSLAPPHRSSASTSGRHARHPSPARRTAMAPRPRHATGPPRSRRRPAIRSSAAHPPPSRHRPPRPQRLIPDPPPRWPSDQTLRSRRHRPQRLIPDPPRRWPSDQTLRSRRHRPQRLIPDPPRRWPSDQTLVRVNWPTRHACSTPLRRPLRPQRLIPDPPPRWRSDQTLRQGSPSAWCGVDARWHPLCRAARRGAAPRGPPARCRPCCRR